MKRYENRAEEIERERERGKARDREERREIERERERFNFLFRACKRETAHIKYAVCPFACR